MQTDFTSALDSRPLLLGQVFDTSLQQIDSAAAEEAIPYGAAVQLGTTSNTALVKVKKLTTGGIFWGIAIRSNIQPFGGVLATQPTDSAMVTVTSGFDSYPIGAMVSVMRVGRVAVMIPASATITDSAVGSLVYYTLASGAITTQTSATAAVVNAAILGTLLTTAVAGKLAVIQINKLI